MSTIEQVLRRAQSGRQTPYRWLARAVSARAVDVLDVGSGAAMTEELAARGRTHRVVQLDHARIALALPGAVIDPDRIQPVCADARAMPFADASFDAVISATGATAIAGFDLFLAEARRVLRPGGIVAVMTPGIYPMTVREAWLHAQLAARVRMAPRLAGPHDYIDIGLALRKAGLRVVEDRRERYRIEVATRADALLVVQALSSRGADTARVAEAADWLAMKAAYAAVPVALPIRRVVAVKN